MSDLIIEKLLEKRDSYLTILKHLSFELMMDLTDIEIKEIKEVHQKLYQYFQIYNWIYFHKINHKLQ